MGPMRKIPVSELRLGMYVTALDRPWLESPFPFQGFPVDAQEQLATLQKTCVYVYIDEERATGPSSSDSRRKTAGRSSDRPITLTMERTDLTGLGWRGRDSFRHDMRKILASRGKLHRHVQRLLSDVRFGRSADTREARILTLELIDVAMANPAAALWLTNLETKHDYTVFHCLNVCILSIVFGLHLGLSNDSIADLALGALLHDVGKMRTPVSILDKPGLLTEDEFDIMKKHPVDGFNILRKDKNIPEKCLEIVQLHHERISGQGYPFGLKNDEIPVHVRIVAITDVYDDITSNRVYHEGVPPHTCLNMMFHWAPRDFGEDLMQEFIRCIGIYPIGSLVELNSNALGIVMSANPASRLRPIVMLIRDAAGKPYDRRPLINLATPSAKGGEPKWSIKRVVDSKEYDINMGRIAELEAGI
ncbi:MAG TPA: HD-GYP domain-containing protein [Gammaproteobacteria bacterium]|nr:HD-GYP domain-containing protein [Gammaproteobacteria bacterium]